MTDHVRSEAARRRREALVVSLMPPRSSSRRRRIERRAAERDDTLDPAVHVLPPGAVARVGDRADAARRRRPDHGRDRPRVPRARSDDGAADQPREAEHQDVRRAVPACRPTSERAARLGAVLHVLYLIFNEGYTSERGPDACSAPISRARRSG